MSRGRPAGDEAGSGPVGPGLAVVFATTGYLALVIMALGVTSLVIDEDVVSTRGLGAVPGVLATATTVAVFAAALWSAVRRGHPSFWNTVWIAFAAFLGYLAALSLGALIAGAGLAVALGVSGRIATTWFGVVLVAAASVAAWSGIALVRTRARRPTWPWESEDEE
ncbi:hypothetical protein QL996_09410 [Planococcus sp. APC 4015]|nr:hypothetical protein [Planococcus sp. APC 4015]